MSVSASWNARITVETSLMCVCVDCRLRDGVSLSESDRVKISSTSDGVYTLRLINVTDEDSGQYTIKAVNDAGQTSCTATLLVHGRWRRCCSHRHTRPSKVR